MKKIIYLLVLITSSVSYSQSGIRQAILSDPAAINTITGNITNSSGYNLSSGSITLDPITGGKTAGAGPYTYTWEKGTTTYPGTSNSLFNLGPGTYTVTVTENKACVKTEKFLVTEPDDLVPKFTGETFISCYGGSTTLTADADGGFLTKNGSYTFSWKITYTDNTTETKAGPVVTGKAGIYELTVFDNASPQNAKSKTITVTQNPALGISNLIRTNVTCKGQSDGTIAFTIIGGSGAYNITWTNSSVTIPSRFNLPKGIYKYTITDKNFATCTFTGDIEIKEPTAPLAVTPSVTQPSLANNDGEIKLTPSGGIIDGENATYTYKWSKDGDPSFPSDDVAQKQKLGNGSYHIIVTSSSGCPYQVDVVLEALNIKLIQQTNVKCHGNATGSLTVQGAGGTITSNYGYQWYKNGIKITGATTNTITGLTGTAPSGDIYTVEVSDDKTTISGSYTITEPLAPLTAKIIIAQKKDVSCNGGSDGAIAINVSDGTPGYTYLWSNNSIVKDQNNLKAGFYSVTVTDSNGCSTSITNIEIKQPDPIVIPNATITKVNIYGQSTGAITLPLITGGNGGYTYKWTYDLDAAFKKTTKDISGLAAGFYTLEVRDAKENAADNAGCIATRIFEVEQNPDLIVSLQETKNILCYGDANGAIKVNVIGGVTDYTYEWYKNNVKITGETQSFIENIGFGLYHVIVKDAVGSSKTATAYNLKQPDKLMVSLDNKTNVLCYGNSTGVININITGGTTSSKPYSIQWKKDGVDYSTDEDLASLGFGKYNLVITDNNLCQTSFSTDIEITQPAAPLKITTLEVKNLSGFETKNGSIKVEISGGTEPYIYSWINQTTNTAVSGTTMIDKLEIGTYKLTITDANSCVTDASYTLIQPDKLLITSITETESIKCNGYKEAVLKATITGGAPIGVADTDKNYIYKWYNNLNSTVVVSTTNPSESLIAGTYYLVVDDGFGNSYTSNKVVINEPTPIKINFVQTNVSCKNQHDGAIYITTSGGTGTHTVTWSKTSDADPNSISNLYAGNYSVTVRDANNCSTTQNFVITEPQILSISKVVKTPPSAVGVDDASIAVTVQGGTANYNFQWYDQNMNLIYTDSNKASNTSIYNIYAGQYFISVTDANGCPIIARDLDKVDPLFIDVVQINTVQCQGAATASIKALTSGGLPDYRYKWYEINNPTIIVGQNETLTNVKAGTYYVIATDSFDKSIQSQNITITEPTLLTNSLSADYIRCGDGKDWTIVSNASQGTAPYTYLWNTGAKTPNLVDTVSGTYTLTVTDKNGCTVVNTINLITPEHLDASEKIKIPTCYEGSDATIVVTPIAGTAPFKYLWNTGEKTNTLSNAAAGEYTVEITDARGCIISRTYSIVNPPKDVIYLGEDVTLCFDQTLTINATIDDDKATYAWTSDKGFKSTQAMITVSQPANYTVVVTNKLGCTATDTIKISSQQTAISAEFAVSSQVFRNEKIIIVDISNPAADKIEWVFPANATVISKNSDFAEISFSEAGEYDITLNTTKGDCTAYQTKQILVTEGEFEENNPDETIKNFDLKIYPNPSNGIFTVDVTLDKIMPANIKVYNLNNNLLIDSKSDSGKSNYLFNFSLTGLPSGIYFVLFESQQGSKLRKIIIQ
ncbi:T9SS type A sorting domain-containing protein [Flavobacterium branchiicola]|uniref:T9SS type A sorting domain-containing protein n=1 Tax=Flavobacterium branchiicola TaxID=1114875 RepID=A0ABV9PCG6_9FLAO|nr:T9SS type A sorting domain-containing protein [Flavobacterium branchiicola]MBS7253180.1 T9SS type A sorting domain-containing protein [Flavobacterium branchiicola]